MISLIFAFDLYKYIYAFTMSGKLPITFNEKFNLCRLGISPDAVRFGNLTMESDKYICVRENAGGKTALTIVDMTAGNQVQRRPRITADAASQNPVSKSHRLARRPESADLQHRDEVEAQVAIATRWCQRCLLEVDIQQHHRYGDANVCVSLDDGRRLGPKESIRPSRLPRIISDY